LVLFFLKSLSYDDDPLLPSLSVIDSV
jgi:hypothetical protein